MCLYCCPAYLRWSAAEICNGRKSEDLRQLAWCERVTAVIFYCHSTCVSDAGTRYRPA
eukprot:SAG25_NODE_5403_length_662_cov_1.351687_1_plen_57_part_01